MKKGFITVLLSVLLSGLTAYAIVKSAAPEQGTAQTKTVYTSDGQAVRTVNLSLSDYPDFTYAAENAVNAVVFVKVTIKPQQRPQQIDPFFRFFFGEGDGDYYGYGNREQKGSGSGVIIRPDGYIVTNNHVVSGATTIEVTLNNNKTYEATVIGADPVTDVALIKIDATDLPVLQFADSDKLRLGEWVLAIGSPLGEELRSTITAGIVSAKGRSMPNTDGQFKIESFIQTDAAVNPGNSGGALVNKEGELVGINTAIVSTTGSYSGYSFAVPSNIVKKVVSDLIDFGSVKRAILGISGITVDDAAAKKFNLNVTEGAYVAEISKGGSADKAGVKAGDVITGIDNVKIASMSELQAKVNSFHPGDKATVKVLRDGKALELPVTFTDGNVENGTVTSEGTVVFYGAELKAVDNGVLIVSAGNGKLARAGAVDGFVIRFVNDQKVSKPQDVIDIAKKSKRSIFIEGVTANGRPGYFGFGKDE
ncbi:MAG: trypsin-like peptidase domain-containing protein [Bacteroidales bacterium]|nr:trypsin-like peptidase domain-containing protein [Bacteroidales bacterium]